MQKETIFFWSKIKAFFFRKDAYLISSPWWLRKFFPGCIWDYKSNEKNIYLTFDDGPHPRITQFVLSQLKQHNATATFFCIGDNVLKYPEIFQQVKAAGHMVGNHTMHHLNGWQNADEVYVDNVNDADVLINSPLFRPPYGRIKRSQIKKLKSNKLQEGTSKNNYQIIMWSVLAGDWDNKLLPEKCFEQVKKNIYPGCIIVMHDSEKAEERLIYVLPKLLKYLTKEGYNIKTINKSNAEITE